MTQEEREIIANNCPHWNECPFPCENCPTFKKMFKQEYQEYIDKMWKLHCSHELSIDEFFKRLAEYREEHGIRLKVYGYWRDEPATDI